MGLTLRDCRCWRSVQEMSRPLHRRGFLVGGNGWHRATQVALVEWSCIEWAGGAHIVAPCRWRDGSPWSSGSNLDRNRPESGRVRAELGRPLAFNQSSGNSTGMGQSWPAVGQISAQPADFRPKLTNLGQLCRCRPNLGQHVRGFGLSFTEQGTKSATFDLSSMAAFTCIRQPLLVWRRLVLGPLWFSPRRARASGMAAARRGCSSKTCRGAISARVVVGCLGGARRLSSACARPPTAPRWPSVHTLRGRGSRGERSPAQIWCSQRLGPSRVGRSVRHARQGKRWGGGRYEDFVDDPVGETQRLVEALGLSQHWSEESAAHVAHAAAYRYQNPRHAWGAV